MKEFQGAYKWYVTASMPQDGSFNYGSWRKHMKDTVAQITSEMNLEEGQRVRVLVNGGTKPLWYTGEVAGVVLNSSVLDNSFLKLKQKKTKKYIDCWRIEKLQILEGAQ